MRKPVYFLWARRSEGLILSSSHRACNVRLLLSEVEARDGFTYTVNDLRNAWGFYLILGIQARAFNR